MALETKTVYYGWKNSAGTSIAYTLTKTPSTNSKIYGFDKYTGKVFEWDPDNEITEYDSSTIPNKIGISYDDGPVEYYYRDTLSDKIIYLTLYAWTSSQYFDKNDISKPLTVYTTSLTPSIGSSVYTKDGEVFDGYCWTGAETGKVSNSSISNVENNTITIGGITIGKD